MQQQPSQSVTGRGSTLVGVFDDRTAAEACVDELHRSGFRDDQIGFLRQGEQRIAEEQAHGTQHAEPKGAVAGAATGGVVGGILGALAAGLIPGIGPIIAGGILAGVIGGVLVGGGVGAIAGALMGMGVPEEDAKYYEGEVKAGRTLVTVRPDGRHDDAYQILNRHGAQLQAAASQAVPGATAPQAPAGGNAPAMQLHEEELRARTQQVQTGEVALGKEVVTERKQIDVPVTREEVVVERHPVEGRPPAPGAQIGEGEVRVPVAEDQVEVEKRTVVREEVGLGKRRVEDTERIEEEVRREEPRIEKKGDVPTDPRE